MVYRIYVEKKEGLDNEARALLSEIRTFLGIDTVERVRIIIVKESLEKMEADQ